MLAWWGSCAVRCGTLCPASQWIKVKVVRLHAVSTSVLTRTPVEITLLFVHVSPLAAYHHSTVSDTDFRLVGAGRQLREREQFTLRLQVHAPLFGRRTVPVYLTRPPFSLTSYPSNTYTCMHNALGCLRSLTVRSTHCSYFVVDIRHR
jgi:hypothetical protein